jgi:hypothetical protein
MGTFNHSISSGRGNEFINPTSFDLSVATVLRNRSSRCSCPRWHGWQQPWTLVGDGTYVVATERSFDVMILLVSWGPGRLGLCFAPNLCANVQVENARGIWIL